MDEYLKTIADVEEKLLREIDEAEKTISRGTTETEKRFLMTYFNGIISRKMIEADNRILDIYFEEIRRLYANRDHQTKKFIFRNLEELITNIRDY